ncbi:MAG: hypothetical protein WCF33_12305 [Pseudonocardiaceae bacterium]
MLVDAVVTDDATAEIIRDTGILLTIRIPGGLLPVHLTVDPPGAARLVHLLAGYADRAQATGLVLDPPDEAARSGLKMGLGAPLTS